MKSAANPAANAVESLFGAAGRKLPGAVMRTGAVGLTVLALALFSLALTRHAGGPPAMWSANAFVVVCLLRSRGARWPSMMASAILGQVAGLILAGGTSGLTIIDAALCDFIEVAICAIGMRRFCGRRIDLSQPRTLVIFAILAAAAPLVSGLMMVFAFIGRPHGAFPHGLIIWQLAHMLGFIVVGPVLLTLRPRTLRQLAAQPGNIALLAVFAVIVAALFSQSRFPPQAVIISMVVLIAFRMEQAGAAIAALLAALIAMVTMVLHGPGAGVSGADLAEALFIKQTTLAITTLSALMIGATLAHRRRLRLSLNASLAAAEAARAQAVEAGRQALLAEQAARASEAELVSARDAAEAAAKAKSDFLANMSHEIRTPLTSIIGFSSLLREAEGLPDAARHYIQRITTAGQSLLSVVNDILDFSKLEAGQVELDPHPFQAVAFVEDTVEMLLGQAENKGLALDLTVEGDVPARIEADSSRLRQVLLNLIGNAIKFTHEGGVVVRMRYLAGGLMRLEITDSGPGIPAERRDRLFQRFSQVDNSVSRSHGGTGLGLAICKSLVALMGGELGVDSEEGRGSTFWFTFAAPASGGVAAAEPERPAVIDMAPAHILVVDDVSVNRELVRAMLEPLGYSFVEARNGAEAVEAALREPFDLILMDLQMPGMDGMSAARAIRAAADVNGATPILALSANVLPDHLAACEAAGMDDHIGKPIQPPRLLAKVAEWSHRRHLPYSPERDVA